MAALLTANNAYSTVATWGIGTGTGTFTVSSSTGSRFPTITGGDWFFVTLQDGSGNIEIIKITARSADTLTVGARAQEGTSARTWTVGDAVELRLTAGITVTTDGTQTLTNKTLDSSTSKIGTLTGVLKGASGTVSAATSGTDYAPGTSALATGILKSTTSTGALSIAAAGTDYQAPIGTISGIAKGNGTNALTAATAGTDYLAGISPNETITITASAPSATTNFDTNTQAVQYYTSNTANNWTLNVRASSGATLDSVMSTGQVKNIAFLATNGATPYYASALTIDGNSATPKWLGGTAPTAGNASAIDVYTYSIIKTGSATFTVIAQQTKAS